MPIRNIRFVVGTQWSTYGTEWREPVENIFWGRTETADRWPRYFDGAVRPGSSAASDVERNARFAGTASIHAPIQTEALALPRGVNRVVETLWPDRCSRGGPNRGKTP